MIPSIKKFEYHPTFIKKLLSDTFNEDIKAINSCKNNFKIDEEVKKEELYKAGYYTGLLDATQRYFKLLKAQGII